NKVKGNVYTNYITFNESEIKMDWVDNGTDKNVVLTVNMDKDSATEREDDYSFKHLASGTITVAKGIKVKTASGESTYNIGEEVENPDTGIKYKVQVVGSASMTNLVVSTESNHLAEVKVSNYVQDTDGMNGPEDDEQDFEFDDSAKTRKFTLPVDLIGKTSDKNILEIDTLEKMYSDYFKSAETTTGIYKGEPFGYYGDFNDKAVNPYFEGSSSTGSILHLSDFDSKEESGSIKMSDEFVKFLEEHVVQPVDRNNKVETINMSAPSWIYQTKASTETIDDELQAVVNASGKTFGGIITNGMMIPSKNDFKYTDGNGSGNDWNRMDNFVYIIDTRSGPVDVYMGDGDGGDFAGTFVVVGTGKATILLPGDPAKSDVTFTFGGEKGFSLYDSRLGKEPSKLALGTASNPTPAPAIDIVVSKNVKEVKYAQNAVGPIQGYVYAPYTTVNQDGGNNGKEMELDIDSFTNVTNGGNKFRISVIGSIFCKNYTSSQKPGVAFIDPDTNAAEPGDKVFAWSDVYFQRGGN
ncbi:MAG: hypothetical protein NC078_05405, partial [Ruminococcus sp.]|nr:hypothetical protein [Ruminococcus sp.]